MTGYTHDVVLVVASIAVAMVAAFSGLALTNNISHLSDNRRKALVVMSSFVLGTGIWSMHFVAMLAHRFPVPVYYDVLQTLSSALVAILVVGVALLLLHFTVRTPRILWIAGSILGIGILSMHYLGMMGIRGAEPFFSPMVSLFSVGVALVMGVGAIKVAYGHRSKQNILAGSLLMGFSVVAVHFTAMHGTRFTLSPDYLPESAVLASSTLAVIVTVAAFVICGTFLLAATTFLTSASPETKRDDDLPEHALANSLASGLSAVPATSQPASAGFAHATSVSTDKENLTTRQNKIVPARATVQVPFERNKKIGFAVSADIAAIRADGHYTHLYTPEGVLFCPWSITEADTRLAGSGFHRTHRSYLVNVDKVTGFEKRRETGICVFENFPKLSSVPVSRNRVIGLLEVLKSTSQ